VYWINSQPVNFTSDLKYSETHGDLAFDSAGAGSFQLEQDPDTPLALPPILPCGMKGGLDLVDRSAVWTK